MALPIDQPRRLPTSLFDYIRPALELDDGTVVPPHASCQDDGIAVQHMLAELRSGELVATGRESPFGERREIPADFWGSVTVNDVCWELNKISHPGAPLFSIYAIDIDYRDPSKKISPTIAAETQCKEWLVGLMRNGAPEKPKSGYLEDAKAKFGVGARGFIRAWRAAVKESRNAAWSRPGRKS